MQRRGQLTDRIKEKAKELLGYDITKTELRLMPYVQYLMVNEQKVNYDRISNEDWSIMCEWQDKGFITVSDEDDKITMTKDFWDKVHEILYLGYVDID